MNCQCLKNFSVERILVKHLGKLGYCVGRKPWHFILGTLIAFGLLSFGLLRQNFKVKTFDLVVPYGSAAMDALDRVEELFGRKNCINFDFGRSTRIDRFARVFIEPKDGGNVLRSDIFREILDFDQTINNITIFYKGKYLQYKDMCAKQDGKCLENNILKFAYKINDIEAGTYKLKYPLMYDSTTLKITFMPLDLGGVTRVEGNIVQSAKAISLFYILNFDDPKMEERNELWELAFLDLLERLKFDNITISYLTSESLSWEGTKSVFKLLPAFTIASIGTLLFSVVSNMTRDCVTSKPWFAVLGLCVALFANGAAFGFCQIVGIPCFAFNITVASLVIDGALTGCAMVCPGIAMDDMFVLLAAWRLTNPQDDVAKRMQKTYEMVGLAVTITSLTNGLAFLIGANTPFLITYMFCSYAFAAVMACYISALTFGGAVLALSGRVEARGLSAYDCRTPAIPWSQVADRNFLVKLFYSRGPHFDQSDSSLKLTATTKFFKTTFSRMTLSKTGSFLIIIVYILYMFISYTGSYSFQVNVTEKELGEDDSYISKFWENFYGTFQEYSQRVQIIVDQELDYSDPYTQKQLEAAFSGCENSTWIAESSLNEIWLRNFLYFTNTFKLMIAYRGFDMNKEEDFIFVLKNYFLTLPVYKRFKNDIVFNENGTKIIASRYFYALKRVTSSKQAAESIYWLKAYLEGQPIKLFGFNLLYPYMDHIIMLEKTTTQSIIIATVIMMIVSLILVHDLLFIFLTTYSIISVEIGIVGFMGFFDIPLGTITMVMLIVSIGFSIDITAHVVCAFKESKAVKSEDRIKEAFSYIGYPIIQGYVTSFLGSTSLYFASSRMKIMLFKIFVLVISFAIFHGLFVLPVIIRLIYFIMNKIKNCGSSSDVKLKKNIEENNIQPLMKIKP
ncbi:daf-6 [Cordylochernes scorpioides]|uniref:Daf-6 n=1 Tax=Cordylochernes scorpioides TaxID=51811 RepID=A0ABY6L6C1_9ARAC|nr:daf-6 [Cordylochernes scorpioides]